MSKGEKLQGLLDRWEISIGQTGEDDDQILAEMRTSMWCSETGGYGYYDDDTAYAAPSFATIRAASLRSGWIEDWPDLLLFDSINAFSSDASEELKNFEIGFVIHKACLETNKDWASVVVKTPEGNGIIIAGAYLDEAWSLYLDMIKSPVHAVSLILEKIRLKEEAAQEEIRKINAAAEAARLAAEAEALAAMQQEIDDMLMVERADYGGF